MIVLDASPSFLSSYENYAAASAALVLGGPTTLRVGTWPARVVVVAATATGTSFAPVTGTFLPQSQRFPAAAVVAGVADARCVMSAVPGALIEVAALSRGLAAGCANWVDVPGGTYGSERAATSRSHTPRWQADLLHYVRSGQAVILHHPCTGFSYATRSALGARERLPTGSRRSVQCVPDVHAQRTSTAIGRVREINGRTQSVVASG